MKLDLLRSFLKALSHLTETASRSPTGRLVLAGLVAFLVPFKPIDAMDFAIVDTRAVSLGGYTFPERKSILATGPIEDGDAAKLRKIIGAAERDFFGNISIFLDSLGGSVGAALEIVAVMDSIEASTFVDDGALCASACASVLYVSGRFHMVLEGGTLGFHACRVGGVQSSICANEIARNAFRHGTGFGTVEAFLRDRETEGHLPDGDGIFWFDRSLACEFGLCGPPSFEFTLAVPSFDCRKARSETEIAICADRRLARYDASLASHYKALRTLMPAAEWSSIQASQRKWPAVRDSCGGNRQCILAEISLQRYALKGLRNALTIKYLYNQSVQRKVNREVTDYLLRRLSLIEDDEYCGGGHLFDGTCEFAVEHSVIRGFECDLAREDHTSVDRFAKAMSFLGCTTRLSTDILSIR